MENLVIILEAKLELAKQEATIEALKSIRAEILNDIITLGNRRGDINGELGLYVRAIKIIDRRLFALEK